MELTEDAVVYDVGAGTGSVSVEAALSGEQIKVYAIEKNPEAVLLWKKQEKIQDGRNPDHRRKRAGATRAFGTADSSVYRRKFR